MKRYLLFSLFALIVGCKGQITEEKAESSPAILTLEQQSEILQKHTIVQDQQYVLTLSRFDAVLQGVSQELYEKHIDRVKESNQTISEQLSTLRGMVAERNQQQGDVVTKSLNPELYFLGNFDYTSGLSKEFTTFHNTNCCTLYVFVEYYNPPIEDYPLVTLYSPIGSLKQQIVYYRKWYGSPMITSWHSRSVLVSLYNNSIRCNIYYEPLGYCPDCDH